MGHEDEVASSLAPPVNLNEVETLLKVQFPSQRVQK